MTVYSFSYFGATVTKKEQNHILKLVRSQKGFDQISDQMFLCKLKAIGNFFDLNISSLSEETWKRYFYLSDEDLEIFFIPNPDAILERLIKPLKVAKKSYCLGDYLATIAMCGLFAEMLTHLIWKVENFKFEGSDLTKETEKILFGNPFEKLGQERKLELLKLFDPKNVTQYNHLNDIRMKRNKFLHFWDVDLKDKATAQHLVRKSFQMFKILTGIGVKDSPQLKNYPFNKIRPSVKTFLKLKSNA